MLQRKTLEIRTANLAELRRHAQTPEKTLVILDRDGVLCRNLEKGITDFSEFELVPGIIESLKQMSDQNVYLSVMTNQHYLATGQLSIEELKKMNSELRRIAHLAGISPGHFTIKVCNHHENEGCECRKPNTGMIKGAVAEFGLDPAMIRIIGVGDKYTDLYSVERYYSENLEPKNVPRSNVTTIFLNWPYGERRDQFRFGGTKNFSLDYEAYTLDEALRIASRKAGTLQAH